jgi:hypothetical protein
MKKLTIYLDDEEVKVLEKRAKKNIFTLKEQVEDIIRTSVIRTKTGKRTKPIKVDDRLVDIFSRHKTGPKPKKKTKKKLKKK